MITSAKGRLSAVTSEIKVLLTLAYDDYILKYHLGSGLSSDPTAAIPAVGHTQRATIDCEKSEIHVMTVRHI